MLLLHVNIQTNFAQPKYSLAPFVVAKSYRCPARSSCAFSSLHDIRYLVI